MDSARGRLIHVVYLLSGMVSLVYQVLWMRQLGLLFGNTAQAAATTLAAFFLGLAAGGWAGGRLAPRLSRPLAAYGWAEIGIALGAALYFGLMKLYGALYPPLFRALGHQAALFVLLKFALGVLVLFPAAALIGATFPLVGQHLLRGRESLGRGGTVLYGVNTVGAALGAWLAAFVLPLALGFRLTYLTAIAANLALGVVVLLAARGTAPPEPAAEAASGASPPPAGLSWTRIRWLAFASGLVTLALEVLWTHMFAQVLHNSVYTFALILVTFLLALAGGSLLAHHLIRRGDSPGASLAWLLGGGSALVITSPWVFYALTGGLRYLGEDLGWGAYQAAVFALAVAVVGPPTVLLGTVFPYLLKWSEAHSRGPGWTLGRLTAINTTAAIAGSLLAGFGLLSWIGLWSSVRMIGLLGLLAIPIALERRLKPVEFLVGGALALALLSATVSGVAQPPLVKLDHDFDERVVRIWQGSSGVVAVVRHGQGLVIKVNNHYTLGGSGELEDERRQGLLPLLLHPHPAEVYYLGMGTGITASAAMTPGVERATVAELLPEVITAARTSFGPYLSGLFTDPRTRVVAEDGRTFLAIADERYDVIVSDLFIPWEARAGSLYSLEHFQSARAHLRPGGVFAQWIPLYQMSRREFSIVARTMLEVFPGTTVWRGDWKTGTPTLALIASTDSMPLDTAVVAARIAAIPDPALLGASGTGLERLIWGYAGRLAALRPEWDRAPLNTDDRPMIEYLAPITHRRVGSHHAEFLVGPAMIQLLSDLQAACPPERDPYLAGVAPPLREYATAGLLLQSSSVLMQAGQLAEADSVDTRLSDLLIRIAKAEEKPRK